MENEHYIHFNTLFVDTQWSDALIMFHLYIYKFHRIIAVMSHAILQINYSLLGYAPFDNGFSIPKENSPNYFKCLCALPLWLQVPKTINTKVLMKIHPKSLNIENPI